MTTKGRRAPAPNERQRDPERTKARIIEAAVEEFSAKGYTGARVSEIARRAGVNQQLIAYYFDGKEGLYREIGRQWRSYEASAFPDGMDFAEMINHYVRLSADPRSGGRLLAWAGLADTGEDEDEEEARDRDARLRQEVEQIRERQRAGELDDRLDPAALHLIAMSAANAFAVYPQLVRGLFGATSPEVVEHYAAQLALLLSTTRRAD
jgi:TetR/AcrR family transcriptional regulator